MEELVRLHNKWRDWHYKNTALLILSLIVFFLFAQHPAVRNTIGLIGSFGYTGAFIIASPFPDEMRIGLIGASKLKNWQFLILSFLLNSIGIFVVVTAARSF